MFSPPGSKNNRRRARVGRSSRQSGRLSRGSAEEDLRSWRAASKRPAKKWVMVPRPPSATASFVVPTWVLKEELTLEERSKLFPEEMEKEKKESEKDYTSALQVTQMHVDTLTAPASQQSSTITTERRKQSLPQSSGTPSRNLSDKTSLPQSAGGASASGTNLANSATTLYDQASASSNSSKVVKLQESPTVHARPTCGTNEAALSTIEASQAVPATAPDATSSDTGGSVQSAPSMTTEATPAVDKLHAAQTKSLPDSMRTTTTGDSSNSASVSNAELPSANADPGTSEPEAKRAKLSL